MSGRAYHDRSRVEVIDAALRAGLSTADVLAAVVAAGHAPVTKARISQLRRRLGLPAARRGCYRLTLSKQAAAYFDRVGATRGIAGGVVIRQALDAIVTDDLANAVLGDPPPVSGGAS